MKHEITSLNTKKLLSASLKKLMGQKPLSKITVSEIIADCGVNRKTFYYHFTDIYDLLKWMFEEEAVKVVEGMDYLVNPEEAFRFALDYVDANVHILNCAYDSMGRSEMKRFFYTDFHGMVLSIIEWLEKEKGISLEADYKECAVQFYSEALAGMLIDYFQNVEKRNREEWVRYTLTILKKSLPSIICKEEDEQ